VRIVADLMYDMILILELSLLRKALRGLHVRIWCKMRGEIMRGLGVGVEAVLWWERLMVWLIRVGGILKDIRLDLETEICQCDMLIGRIIRTHLLEDRPGPQKPLALGG
jgi:hypothetical protein